MCSRNRRNNCFRISPCFRRRCRCRRHRSEQDIAHEFHNEFREDFILGAEESFESDRYDRDRDHRDRDRDDRDRCDRDRHDRDRCDRDRHDRDRCDRDRHDRDRCDRDRDDRDRCDRDRHDRDRCDRDRHDRDRCDRDRHDNSDIIGNNIDICVRENDSEIKANIRVQDKHEQSVRIWGRVLDSRGNGVPFALVKLVKVTCRGLQGIAHTICDCEGFYQFEVSPREDGREFLIIVSKPSTGPERVVSNDGRENTNCPNRY
ncbi:hypothetical protein [Clostridium cylindrosporum]|uniref:Uncharacterized protein n=1 Tax=Clostridium cylindrosporum DSM 605 TaxID=1121307 RepID=A0A0J8DDP7_CLOCY|nr:hypothetical protein [Clostridium cylindrosporum]KMT22348.1 hypothetical protein CLCY_20c00060 [Clostridium cylindrosporum DSM 605]